MIESPTTTAVRIDTVKSVEDKAPLLEKEISETFEVFPVRTKPITGKILRTMKHLRNQAGPWARFRGFQVEMVYNIIYYTVVMALSVLVPISGSFIVTIVSAVLLCRLQMTLTHVIISLPSNKPWYHRMPSGKNIKKIIIPTIVWVLAEQAAVFVPVAISGYLNMDLYTQNPDLIIKGTSKDFKCGFFSKLLLVVVAGILSEIFILLPAAVTLIRIEASMLPEDEDYIVPFDRSFGGKVQPESLGGSGAVSMLDAWKSFDWAARFRLIKLYLKVQLIQFTTVIVFAFITAAELVLILGKQNIKLGVPLNGNL